MPASTLIPWSSYSTPVLSFTSFRPLNIYISGFRSHFRIPEQNEINVSPSKKSRSTPSIAAKCSNRLANGVRRKVFPVAAATGGGGGSVSELDDNVRKILQAVLWVAEGVYIVWLFLLPYAPGDPIWSISPETISSLIGLSLNFFFVLPLLNSGNATRLCWSVTIVGIHLIEAPVLHPMSEGLFNFVIGWTFMFAPLLYTDKNRDRYMGSLDVLWAFQMFLTNTFLLPYMAIRLNKFDGNNNSRKNSQLGLIMTNGASIVGLLGGLVCSVSILWAVYGRGDSNFGDLAQRWEFLLAYLGTERLAYAFIWDICLYSIFQPWLIGANIQNIKADKVGIVNFLRFVPFIGLTTYCLFLSSDGEI
ncbi:hypothetical protein F511_23031 [Dorcoceras hygrometricum]|uniref:Transmembrane protein n=1 Tax=Dorcoceras hygrometricum TaxID=472368 RepID=A0A2Z7CK33_9LAMI|nr:hypothetical protein F511_23031 [Dorcoceras hygrometricum]